MVLVRDDVGLEGEVVVAVNSRHVIRERPHVCTISESDGKEEGGGEVAVHGSYENCSVLKHNSDCNTAQHNILQSCTSLTLTLSFPLFLTVTYTKHACHMGLKHLKLHT